MSVHKALLALLLVLPGAMAAGIAAGSPPVSDAGDGTTPLHWAVHRGDHDAVRSLLKSGADARAINDYGSTPMSEAAERGDATLLRLLLKAGADVESANPEGQTALMTVARTGSVEAARVLLRAGADVNAAEHWRGQTALMWAAAQGHEPMVRLLLEAGADPDARSAVREWPRRITAEPRIQGRPVGGLTALLLAAREGCAACARTLTKAGADIDLADPDGVTPLLMATLNARWDTALVLVERGADVNLWDKWGRAPLYSAIDYNTTPRGGRPDRPSADQAVALEVARQLLERGADPDMQLKLFPPYRSLGQDRGGDAMLTTGTTPLLRAAKSGDIEAIQLLLKHGASADLPNSMGITPFMAAAGVGSTLIDIRGRFRNEQRCIEAAKLLLAAGARVDAQRDNGQTALHGAANWGWNEFVRFLAANGAPLEAKDRNGATALDVAQGKGGALGRGGVAGPEAQARTAAVLQELLSAARRN
ncbi:MAG: hypothetical protein RL026_2698 [Pseudomonadota bacterium]|jgi:ankyrin repeat protein